MAKAKKLKNISLDLHEIKHHLKLRRKSGVRAALKRQSHRLERQLTKAELRQIDLEAWTAGEFEIEPLFPTTQSVVGSTIYVDK